MKTYAFVTTAGMSLFLAVVSILFCPAVTHSIASEAEAAVGEPVLFQISDDPGVFVVGEELEYNVSYTIFDLGKVRFTVMDTISKFNKTVYVVKAFVDSYDGVPFVDLHQVFYSQMTSDPYSMLFTISNTADPKETPYTQYTFDYANQKVSYEMGKKPQNTVSKKGTEPVTTFQQDGLSLFFYARSHCQQLKKESVPIFVNEKSFFTQFNFMNKIGSQEIDAVSYPIETIEFDGTADFTGIFGLTGYFKGYFSNDKASIPIVAKMKVILGSIHIELIRWKRPGWIPPKAK